MNPLLPMQWTTGLLGILIAAAIIYLVRKDQIHIRHSVWWLIIAAMAVILGFFPWLVDIVGVALGVHYPPILLHTLALGMILVKILTMDLERSKLERRLRSLIQRVAVLELEIKRLGGSCPPEDK